MQRGSRRAGGILTGLLMGFLALVVLLVAGALILGLFVARSVRVEEVPSREGKVVRVETPVGSMRIHEGSGAGIRHLGMPVYPGAAADSSKGKMVDFELNLGRDRKGFDVAAAEYSTTDPVADVADFYRKELPQWISSTRDGRIEMKYSEEGYQRIIVIRRRGGLTRISLIQAGEPQVN